MFDEARPGELAKVIRFNPKTAERHMDHLAWGLLPHDARNPATAPRPINARAETVQELPIFADAFRRRRALVPVDRYVQRASRGDDEGRRFAISRIDDKPMAWAGLWEAFTWPDGRIERTFCVITIEANDPVSPHHDRMPVVLEQGDWPLWLGEAPGDPATLLRASAPGVLRLEPARTSKRERRLASV